MQTVGLLEGNYSFLGAHPEIAVDSQCIAMSIAITKPVEGLLDLTDCGAMAALFDSLITTGSGTPGDPMPVRDQFRAILFLTWIHIRSNHTRIDVADVLLEPTQMVFVEINVNVGAIRVRVATTEAALLSKRLPIFDLLPFLQARPA